MDIIANGTPVKWETTEFAGEGMRGFWSITRRGHIIAHISGEGNEAIYEIEEKGALGVPIKRRLPREAFRID